MKYCLLQVFSPLALTQPFHTYIGKFDPTLKHRTLGRKLISPAQGCEHFRPVGWVMWQLRFWALWTHINLNGVSVLVSDSVLMIKRYNLNGILRFILLTELGILLLYSHFHSLLFYHHQNSSLPDLGLGTSNVYFNTTGRHLCWALFGKLHGAIPYHSLQG